MARRPQRSHAALVRLNSAVSSKPNSMGSAQADSSPVCCKASTALAHVQGSQQLPKPFSFGHTVTLHIRSPWSHKVTC
ncbi:hypothetical protein CC78DRAFT_534607, partial [Lojkania enalia]